MTQLNINPWELGDDLQSTVIPSFVLGDFTCVKLAHPKQKTVRDGLVGSFLMTSYTDENGNKVELVEASETPEGYEVKFPLGKRGLIGTKYRGPQNSYRFINPETKKWFQIPKERFTEEYALEYLPTKVDNWSELSDVEKDSAVDEYLQDMFLFGLSQDLALPAKSDGSFEKPIVGLTTQLYRVSTPPKEGEKYPNVKITKWEKGKPSLDGEHKLIPEGLALAIYDEYLRREEDQFDPTTFKEAPKDSTSDDAPF